MSLTGSCHCGKVAFQVMGEIPEKLTRCTCSLCAKRGGLHAYYRPDQFTLTTPFGEEGVYRWNDGNVAHHFCPECGCFTFMDSPDAQPGVPWDGKTRRIGVNARLFDDFDADDHPVKVVDGKNLW
jgi:hypothetical protein